MIKSLVMRFFEAFSKPETMLPEDRPPHVEEAKASIRLSQRKLVDKIAEIRAEQAIVMKELEVFKLRNDKMMEAFLNTKKQKIAKHEWKLKEYFK